MSTHIGGYEIRNELRLRAFILSLRLPNFALNASVDARTGEVLRVSIRAGLRPVPIVVSFVIIHSRDSQAIDDC